MTKTYYERKEKHICVYCEAPVTIGVMCATCKTKYTKTNKFTGRKLTQNIFELQRLQETQFLGQIIIISALTALPIKIFILHTDLVGLLNIFVKKYAQQPQIVYKFNRTIGSLYFAEPPNL